MYGSSKELETFADKLINDRRIQLPGIEFETVETRGADEWETYRQLRVKEFPAGSGSSDQDLNAFFNAILNCTGIATLC